MLELRSVSKRYGALTAVRNVSLSVSAGEVLGYLGPNGSGKSSTVRMIVGLSPTSQGTVLFDGVDIQADLRSYKAKVGYVPEEAHLYSYLSAAEYLRLCGRLRGIPPALLEAKVERFLLLFELDVDRHVPLGAFSKGMRQKVLISSALLHNPRLIILDEPTTGLDVTTSLVLRGLVDGLAAAGRIIFYSSHELDVIERTCRRVVILRSGQVVADGSAEEVRSLVNGQSLEAAFAHLAVSRDLGRLTADLLDTVQMQ